MCFVCCAMRACSKDVSIERKRPGCCYSLKEESDMALGNKNSPHLVAQVARKTKKGLVLSRSHKTKIKIEGLDLGAYSFDLILL